MRRPRLRYVSPGVCEASFSGSGTPLIILDALARGLGPTGLVLGGSGGFQLSWNNYPGALCFSVYKAVDELDPFGPYVLIAECITDNFIDLDSFGPGVYRVTAITEEGESDPSDPIVVEGAGSVVVTVIADPDATSPYGGVPGVFIISKEGFHNTDLVVNFVISGTAQNGVDYEPIGATATILSGQSSVTVDVTAILEANDPEPPETVILSLTAGGFYIVGIPDVAVVIIEQCPPEHGDPVPADNEASATETFIASTVMDPRPTVPGPVGPHNPFGQPEWIADFGVLAPSVYEIRYMGGAWKASEECGCNPGFWMITCNNLQIYADGVVVINENDGQLATNSQAEAEANFGIGRTFEVSADNNIQIHHVGAGCPGTPAPESEITNGSPNPTFELWQVAAGESALLDLPANIRVVAYDPSVFDTLECPGTTLPGGGTPEWEGTLSSVFQSYLSHVWQGPGNRKINGLGLTETRVEFRTNNPNSENGRGWRLEIVYQSNDFESSFFGWAGWKSVGDGPAGIYYRDEGCHLTPECIALEEYTP